jgi:hypothetical protein
MGQVTIYLDNETERKLNVIIGDMNVSKSKWISDLIRTKTATSWPESVIELAGAWKDLPLAEEIQEKMGRNTLREPL